ncbi:MAG TPA: WYL domain-containing protein [Acetobacteraceae bacterium]|nr:WYL domain-containing protein [Acetobacteraceae bacterium]
MSDATADAGRARLPLPPPSNDNHHPRLASRAAYLAAAIRARRAVHLLYGGSWRVVHPHAVGHTTRGTLALLAWQTAGYGRSGEREGWRLFDITRIDEAEELRATFTPRPRRAEAGEGWTAGIRETVAAV